MPKSKYNEKGAHSNNAKGAAAPLSLAKQNDHAFSGHGKGGDFHTDNYTFTFSSDLSTVQSMSEVENTRSKAIDLTTSTFKTTVGINDKNVQAVLSVEQTNSDSNVVSTRIYSDKDGDGQYVKNFDIQVAKVADARLFQQKFTVNADGTVTADTTALNNHHGDALAQTAVLTKTALDNVAYITQTQAVGTAGDYRFDVFRDDNNDGVWTEIAHGQTSAVNIDATTGAINLVGLQSYLTNASAIIG